MPLKLFWSAERGDNFTTATPEGERDAIAANYVEARVEGHVYRNALAGTLPLKLFWSSARGDNFTSAAPEGEQAALAAGYLFVRTEGYVLSVANP